MYFALVKKYQNVLFMCLLFWQVSEILATDCCTEGETKADPNDCTSYLICNNGAFVSKTCVGNTYWNTVSEACIPNDGTCCPGTETCKENELQVDPQNCAGYFKCIKGQLVSQKCASGSYFDTTVMACVIDSDCVCPSS